jgi:hypothetical protein
MNKAFVREPEFDGRAYCPRCGSLGTAVGAMTLDHHVRPESRAIMRDSAWFCGFARCEVAYFDLLERVVPVSELRHPVYPKDPSAAICPCFGFTPDDVDAAIQDRSPASIRELLAKSKSEEARCGVLAPDGECCLREVQRLYIRGTNAGG